jgi:rubrerythrin
LGWTAYTRREKNMAGTKTAAKKTAKKAAVKTTAKKTVAKKAATKTKGMAKGSQYTCGVCGLSVKVANPCDCPGTSHLVCCEKPMRKKKQG